MDRLEHVPDAHEVWVGVKEISRGTHNLGSRVYTLANLPVSQGGLPTFRIGKLHALRRSTYFRWIEKHKRGE